MQVLTEVDPQTASGPTKDLFDQIEHSLKRIPTMLRLMANSPPVLEAYLRFSEALGRTTLTPRLRGFIAVAVAEINRCDYTLSTALALGRREGVTESDLQAARHGEASDGRSRAALRFASAIVRERGHVQPPAVEELYEEGFSDEEIVELVACVALNVFRNYFNLVAGTDIDVPLVMASPVVPPTAQAAP